MLNNSSGSSNLNNRDRAAIDQSLKGGIDNLFNSLGGTNNNYNNYGNNSGQMNP